MPRAVRESATANGITPPPAIRPTGDEISKAPDVMAPAAPSSLSVARASREAQCAMLAVADECQDLRDCRIRARQRLHVASPFGKNPRSVEQLLIERAYRPPPLSRELATLH